MVIYPKYISLNMWAADLYNSYPDSAWPVLRDESKWQEWAATVCKVGIFFEANVPVPRTRDSNLQVNSFNHWEEWATQAFLKIIEHEISQSIVSVRGF